MTGTRKLILRPSTAQNIILCTVIILKCASLTSSTAIIPLKLIKYTNPKHQELKGGCCEWVCWELWDIGVCDNYISLCVDDVESVSDSMDRCSYYKMEDFYEGDDDFFFPSTHGSYHPNPIVFEVINYKGGVRLKLDVWDKDGSLLGLNPDDHIDFYNEEICITPSPSAITASTQYLPLYGRGSSKITIEVKAYCADDYYDINCSVYCVACDNNDEGHYTCDPSNGTKICMPGYDGTLCKIDINECESSPCQNGGSCRDYQNYFTCDCVEGVSGERCETVLEICDSNPCYNNATCIDEITSFSCECAGGFEGEFCETEIDECQSNPCQIYGSCVDIINGFQCDCVDGYNGLLCEKDVDECASGPCANEATCTDNFNGYSCSCAGGFEGDLCETEINECHSDPCQNSGTCLDMINGFQCICVTGYYGLLCETDHDDCASGPCSNGATCTDVLNGYVCTCAPGFFGVHCKGSMRVFIGIAAVVVVVTIILIATFLYRRHYYVRSYNLKSRIEYKPL